MTAMTPGGGSSGAGVMVPGNPAVAGTVLRIPAVQSPNYVPGTSGWIIRVDGTAEFAGLTIDSGNVVLGGAGQILIYNGAPAAGNLIMSIAATADTDPFGNAFPEGINVTSPPVAGFAQSSVLIAPVSGGAQINLAPAEDATLAVPWVVGDIVATAQGAGNTAVPLVEVFSPSNPNVPVRGFAQSRIDLKGGTGVSGNTEIDLVATNVIVTKEVTGSGGNLEVQGTTTLDGAATGRGNPIATVAATTSRGSDSAGISTVETTVMTLTLNATSGVLYDIDFALQFAQSVATDIFLAKIRLTSSSGTVLNTIGIPAAGTTAVGLGKRISVQWTAGATGSQVIVLTLLRFSGTGTIVAQSNSTGKAVSLS